MTRSRLALLPSALAFGVLAAAAPAAATTITEYDRLPAQAQQSLVDGALAAIAQRHGAIAAACISAYEAPAPGGDRPRIDADLASLLERSRAVAPDDFAVENLLEGMIMVECGIAPEQ